MSREYSRRSKTGRLQAQGFDQSYPIGWNHGIRVRCSQCEAATINGIPCHERGCPNANGCGT